MKNLVAFLFDNISSFLLMGWLILSYRNASNLLGLSKDNPKVKSAKSICLLIAIVLLIKMLIPIFNLDELFSTQTNNKTSIGISSILFMYIGNTLPRLQVKNKVFNKPTNSSLDMVFSRNLLKYLGYILLSLGFLMFVSNFLFDLTIIGNMLTEIIVVVLSIISILCLVLSYLKIILIKN